MMERAVTEAQGHAIDGLFGIGYEPAQLLLGSMADLALLVDRDGRILYSNREAPGQEVAGTTLFEHELGPEAQARIRVALHQVFERSKPMSYEVKSPGASEDAETSWFLSRWSPIERDGEVIAALIIASDITPRVKLDEVILQAAAEGILGLDRDGVVTLANPAAADLLGVEVDDLQGRNLHDLVHSRGDATPSHDADQCPALLSLRSGMTQHLEDDVFWCPNGSSSFPVTYTASPICERGEVTGAVFTFNDVTERKRFEAQLQYLADHDAVTGLFNRRRFEEELDRHLAYDARYGSGGAVLVLDLDNFKNVNDTLGHKAGDEVIGRIARNLRERIRESDTLARLGGDEFAVLIPQAGIEQAQAVARAVIEAVHNQAVMVGGQQTRVTASVGITTFGTRDGVKGEELLVEADLAMYEAKAAGRDQFALYTPMAVREAQIETRLAWAGRIRGALDEERLTLYSQPIVSVSTREVVQHELFVRMVEDAEPIAAGAFVPSAERFGLMPAIDHWVVGHAPEVLAALDPSLRLEINVSGESLGSGEVIQTLRDGLLERGLDPGRLVVQISEAAAIANIDEARTFAGRVKELGCLFALDDFGAGFGSFYYLKYLPFDYLKIDGDFIHSLPASRTDQLVVQALVDVAQGLGKQTVAEYVGDDDTLELLRECGVDLAQGYHLGRPAPASELLGR